jgi:chemotaxis protein MotA
MIIVVGCIVVIGAVLGGFTMAGGHIGALIHPSELLTIGGAAVGALVVSSPKKVLVDLAKGLVTTLKGTPYTKSAYEELFKCMYDMMRLARRDGLLALESHVYHPENSNILARYPRINGNPHLVKFICGGLAPLIEATAKPEQLAQLLEAEVKVLEEEHDAPTTALQKMADALPGFGIVAAVMGIVITMGAIGGPAEEIGEKVGAALVGTFLGILLSYGFAAPLATRLHFLGVSQAAFFRIISTVLNAFAQNFPPKVALELARRGMATEVRPDREELDRWFKEAEESQ